MKQPLMKRLPGAVRILALLMALALLAGCGAPSTTPETTTTPQEIVTEATTGSGLPPQQDPHDEPTEPVTQPVTDPTSAIPTLPAVTEPTTTQPIITEPVITQPTVTEPTTTQPIVTEPVTQPSQSQTPSSGSFTVHFIDVGQADAALIMCEGKTMLIDGGNADDSNLMYTYLSKLGVDQLDYVIGTHAHEDHIGGIAGALNYAGVNRVLCPVTSYSTKAFNNFVKAVQNRGQSITIPSVGDQFTLGSANCQVLAVNSTSDTNESSIVLRITYGSTSFMFTGDAEQEAENMILNRSFELKSDVLKVGHHGSASSTSYRWLREVDPDYAVISVGKDNSYGHPTETVLSRLRDADVTTYRTDLQGDIICTSDGRTITFQVSRNQNADTLGGIGNNSTQQGGTSTGSGEEMQYILNTGSMKFHYPICSSAKKISSKNRKTYFGTREELLEQGYTPCGYCDP